jgi:hypothetical protein
MTRRRLDEMLAAAQLAPMQLQQAQQQGANDAAVASQFANTLSAVPQIAGTLINFGKKEADEDAATAAKKAVAASVGTTGDYGTKEAAGPTEDGAPLMVTDKSRYAQTPGDIAKKAVDPLSSMATGSWNPFAADAANKAQAEAQLQIAGNVQANRDRAREIARQQAIDAQNADKTTAEIGATNASTAKSTADVGDLAAQAKAREIANAKAERDQAIGNTIAPVLAGRAKIDAVIAAHPEFDPGEIIGAFNTAKTKADITRADIGAKGAQTAQGYAAAEKDRAEAGKFAREPGGKPLAQDAQNTLAKAQTTMSGLARLAGMDADFVAGHPEAGQGIANVINKKLRTLGADDPQRSQLLGETMAQFLEWKQNVAGVRFSPELLEKEQQAFVSASDNP